MRAAVMFFGEEKAFQRFKTPALFAVSLERR
jgi:hypothetical protein